MKKINLTLIVIFLTSFVYAQSSYYWSAGKKHYLKKQSDTYVVKLEKEQSFEDAVETLESKRSIEKLIKIKQDIGIVFAEDALDVKELKEYKEFSNVMPAYQLKELPIYFTGEILMQPKNNVSIEDILKLANYKISVKNRTKYGSYILGTDDWDKLLEYSNLIYESGLVEYCHPNLIAPRKNHQVNDPKYSEQYYLNNTGQFGGTIGIDINAPEAWNITTGSCPIRVAVIDDGVENHEDLNGRVLQGFTPQFSQQNPNTLGAPNANNPPSTTFPYDSDKPFGHGQCCAGIIAASHNSLGIRGIAPSVEIVPINIFNDWFVDQVYYNGSWVDFINYSEDIQDIVNAIDFAWDDAEADVISNSWSFTDPGANFDAITLALGRARTQGRTQGVNHLGCVVVFASGNDDSPYDHLTVRFPANVDGVLTVGAIDKNGNIHNYSCRGNSMDLVAPSGGNPGDVRTIDREGSDGYVAGNYYDEFNGTSAACPQVAGVAALMLSVRPDLTETQIRTTLQQTATDMGITGFDNTYGYGRVNAFAALQSIFPTITGSDEICNSEVFSISNLPANANVTWSVSSGGGTILELTEDSPSINQVTIRNLGGSIMTNLIASINVGCGDPIVVNKDNIWSGEPAIYAYGQHLVNIYTGMPVYDFCFGSPNDCKAVHPAGDADIDDWEWRVTGATIYPYGHMDQYATIYPNNYSTFGIEIRAHNQCGWSEWARMGATAVSCRSHYLSISPNPSSGETTVSIKSSDENDKNRVDLAEWDLEVFTQGQQLKGKKSKIRSQDYKINTQGWQEGVYIVKAKIEDEILTGKLVVQK